jgi:hypothetical protein
MKWLLCLIGKHDWYRAEFNFATYVLCYRCHKEKI